MRKLDSLMSTHWFLAPALIMSAFILNTVVVFVSNTGVYGCTNAQVSNDNYTLITPPGWAFAIWGAIFTWEGIACVYCSLSRFNDNSRLIVDGRWIGAWLCTCVIQSAWSIVFCQSVYVAAVLLFLIFFSLLFQQQYALRRLSSLSAGPSGVGVSGGSAVLSDVKRFALYLITIAPFSLHLGWVLAASLVGLNITFVHPGSHSPATVLAAALGSLLMLFALALSVGVFGTPMARNTIDGGFVGGVVWALAAISRHDPRPVRTSVGMYSFSAVVTDAIKSAAACAAIVLAVSFLVSFLLRRLLGSPLCRPMLHNATPPAPPSTSPTHIGGAACFNAVEQTVMHTPSQHNNRVAHGIGSQPEPAVPMMSSNENSS